MDGHTHEFITLTQNLSVNTDELVPKDECHALSGHGRGPVQSRLLRGFDPKDRHASPLQIPDHCGSRRRNVWQGGACAAAMKKIRKPFAVEKGKKGPTSSANIKYSSMSGEARN